MKPLSILLLGKEKARQLRSTREMYYRWQERDLRKTLAQYIGIIDRYDHNWADIDGMGREFYQRRARMIRNELRHREIGP